jgi:hypothetical protein
MMLFGSSFCIAVNMGHAFEISTSAASKVYYVSIMHALSEIDHHEGIM